MVEGKKEDQDFYYIYPNMNRINKNMKTFNLRFSVRMLLIAAKNPRGLC